MQLIFFSSPCVASVVLGGPGGGDVQWAVARHDHAGDEDTLADGETLELKGLNWPRWWWVSLMTGSSSSDQEHLGGGVPLTLQSRKTGSFGFTTFSLKEDRIFGVPSATRDKLPGHGRQLPEQRCQGVCKVWDGRCNGGLKQRVDAINT
ncbi:hypothetical protein EYF80_020014 [Liparis tanakae]|uniref:Uncharacterized protein n=1 Tax=Liparis tanakae TaxID=230148 RepID=A0A4Z2HXX1_9TELE|nr:hypothetical protein EYF80_020014 [Liparis tanakae]